MMNEKFELRGTKENPYHLSVAAVLFNEEGKVAVIRKRDNYFCLPRETIYADETLIQGLKRGLGEEVGVDCVVKRYLGSLVNHFDRADGTDIEKTTLYFEAKLINSSYDRTPENDEVSDEVFWVSPDEAVKLIEGSSHIEGGKNEECLIIPRAQGHQ